MQEFYCTFAEIAHDRETTPSRQKMKKVHALLAGVFRKVKKNRRRNKHLCQANRSTRTDRADQSGVGVKRKKLVVLEILASQIGPFFFRCNKRTSTNGQRSSTAPHNAWNGIMQPQFGFRFACVRAARAGAKAKQRRARRCLQEPVRAASASRQNSPSCPCVRR